MSNLPKSPNVALKSSDLNIREQWGALITLLEAALSRWRRREAAYYLDKLLRIKVLSTIASSFWALKFEQQP